MRVFIIATLCGVAISASYYVIQPLKSWDGNDKPIPPLLWPVYLLSHFNVVPRVFVARIIWEVLRAPVWLGEVIGALYWPVLGAFVGMRQSWVTWGVVVLAVNIVPLALVLYVLSRTRLTS